MLVGCITPTLVMLQAPTGRSVGVYSIEERPEEPISPGYKMADHGHRERSGSTSTQKSLG